MPTSSIRGAVKLQLITIISAALPGVQVVRGWPGNETQNECVVMGRINGVSEIPQMAGPANRYRRRDEWTIELWFFALKQGQTADEAEDRVEAMFSAVDVALSGPYGGPYLAGAVPGLQMCVIHESEGPESQMTLEGWSASWRVTLACTARLD